jgi:TfoX/Sxy family transcriptional regulator of competence genes
MAYSTKLAERIQGELSGISFVEKKMFGGVGYPLNGNMACGVNKDDLIVRVDPGKFSELLEKPHAKTFDLTGKPMKGWLIVEPEGYQTPKQLAVWVREGVEFAMALPPK